MNQQSERLRLPPFSSGLSKVSHLLEACIIVVFACGTGSAHAAPTHDDHTLTRCDNVDDLPSNGSEHDCEWASYYDTSLCNSGAPCDNLVIFFSGGGMGCEDGGLTSIHAAHLFQYANDGYVTASACVVSTDNESGENHFFDEHIRVDYLVSVITTALKTTAGVWTGKNLLLSGASHGGAALTHALANASEDYEETYDYWWGDDPGITGTRDGTTAVCLYDPPLDPRQRELEYFADPQNVTGADDCTGTRNKNICNRYNVKTVLGTTVCGAANPDFPCAKIIGPEPASCTARLDADDIATDAAGSEYGHDDFLFVSCTGEPESEEACEDGEPNDESPEVSMDEVCDAIDLETGKHCEVASYDEIDHGGCISESGPKQECKTMFEEAIKKIAFITSDTYDGNLGNTTGADTKCQDAADDADLPGTFKAWLSVSGTDAASRLNHSSTPYYRTDGTVLADDWADLVNGSIDVTFSIDENGSATASSHAWTGTNDDGTYRTGTNCSSWGSNNSGSNGHRGTTSATNSAWSESLIADTCNTQYGLYCLEQ